MPLLIPELRNFTPRQIEAYSWARDGVEAALDDPDWLRDNPRYADSVVEQYADMIYRLTDQAEDMICAGEPATLGFARAAKNAAGKLADWYCAKVFPGDSKQ